MKVLIGWLAVVLIPDDNGVLACSFSRTGPRSLPTRCGPVAQTGHKDFIIRDGESSGYIFVATDKASAYLYTALGFHLYVHYSVTWKKLLREAFDIEAVEIRPINNFAGHGCVQHVSSERRGERFIGYHSFLTAKNSDSPDAKASATEAALLWGQKCTRCRQKKNLD